MKRNYDKNAIDQYILNAIDADGYDNAAPMNTTTEKLTFLDKTFRAEYGWLVERDGYQNAMREWIQGLPSSFNIEYRNDEILKLAYQWGSLKPGATDNDEQFIIDAWFAFMANKTAMLIRKHITA